MITVLKHCREDISRGLVLDIAFEFDFSKAVEFPCETKNKKQKNKQTNKETMVFKWPLY